MNRYDTFVETTAFTKRIAGLISDDAFAEFQAELAQNPENGPVIEGTGGLRKVRWHLPGSGKSGGLRIIYLVFVFAENEAANLSASQKKQLRAIVNAIKQEYRK